MSIYQGRVITVAEFGFESNHYVHVCTVVLSLSLIVARCHARLQCKTIQGGRLAEVARSINAFLVIVSLLYLAAVSQTRGTCRLRCSQTHNNSLQLEEVTNYSLYSL